MQGKMWVGGVWLVVTWRVTRPPEREAGHPGAANYCQRECAPSWPDLQVSKVNSEMNFYEKVPGFPTLASILILFFFLIYFSFFCGLAVYRVPLPRDQIGAAVVT